MKVLLYVLILFPSLLSAQATHTLIDFSTFEESIQQVYPNAENSLTAINGTAVAELGYNMFLLSNWVVGFTCADAMNKLSKANSYSKKINDTERGTILGVRMSFPDWPYAGESYIKPRFPIMPFKPNGEYANINNGVVTNVGIIKSVSMWVSGRNFNIRVGVRMTDINDKVTEFGLGSMLFVGWRKLVYNNVNFTTNPYDQVLPRLPIYPSDIPLLKFQQLSIYKPADSVGDDIVAYFGNIDMEYTPYTVNFPTDINDEEEWGIIRKEQRDLALKLNSVIYEKIQEYEYARIRLGRDYANSIVR